MKCSIVTVPVRRSIDPFIWRRPLDFSPAQLNHTACENEAVGYYNGMPICDAHPSAKPQTSVRGESFAAGRVLHVPENNPFALPAHLQVSAILGRLEAGVEFRVKIPSFSTIRERASMEITHFTGAMMDFRDESRLSGAAREFRQSIREGRPMRTKAEACWGVQVDC